MSLPKDGGLDTAPPAVAALTPSKEPCPAGPDVPREGSREIQKKGKVISVPWDWCKSKEKPVAYKIWCWQADAGNLANTVRQTDCRSHVVGSYVKVCYGDEPGHGGGVKSGTCQAECTLIAGSPTVRAEGRPIGRRFDKWDMNHGNTWGCLENPEDTGNYNAPKVKLIKAQLNPPDPSREDDIQAAAQGTKVAQAGGATMPLTGSAGGGATVVSPGTVARGVGAALATPEAGALAVGGGIATGVGLGFGTAYNAHINNMLTGPNITSPGIATPSPHVIDPSAPGPTIEQIDKAYAVSQAQALAKAKVKPNTWVRITQNPCAALACGVPGSRYRGGTYLCTRATGIESHHTPAQSVSYLPPSAGPAIQMDPMDHKATLSYGGGLASAAYRTTQSGLISSGNFMGAVAMDVADVKSHFGGKYDQALAQMVAYAECLKKNGFVR